MRISCIYKITNLIDGKVYIGQTINYRKRKTNHFRKLELGNHANMHLQRAYDKYGRNSFKIEIIKECEPDELDDWEIYYIGEYKACDRQHGYNLIDGGQKYRCFTLEVREKMSRANKGRKFTAEHKRKISEAQKGKIIKQSSIEKCKETRKKNHSSRGEKNPNASLDDAVATQILLEILAKNEILTTELAEKYNVSRNVIYRLAEGKAYTHLLEEKRQTIREIRNNNFKNKCDKAIELYNEGYSQNQIARMLNISRNTIRKLISC